MRKICIYYGDSADGAVFSHKNSGLTKQRSNRHHGSFTSAESIGEYRGDGLF